MTMTSEEPQVVYDEFGLAHKKATDKQITYAEAIGSVVGESVDEYSDRNGFVRGSLDAYRSYIEEYEDEYRGSREAYGSYIDKYR